MSVLNIKHEPIFNTAKLEQLYTEKDGVPVRYVCTSALGGEARAMDIFYRETPHPEFGNLYFGIFKDHLDRIMITGADRIEDAEFAMIEDSEGNYHYSAHRHDCKIVDGKMVDGGRAYVRTNGNATTKFVVIDGEFVENNMVPRDGKMYKMIDNAEHVGVLVSGGYGAGWFSWNTDIESCLFDPEIVSIVEKYKNQDMSTQLLTKIATIAEHKWPEGFWGGAS